MIRASAQAASRAAEKLIKTSKLVEGSPNAKSVTASILDDTSVLPPARACGARASCASDVVRPAGGFIARWSSLAAQRAHNPEVGGSNPPRATRSGRHEKSTGAGAGNGVGESCDLSTFRCATLSVSAEHSTCGSDLLSHPKQSGSAQQQGSAGRPASEDGCASGSAAAQPASIGGSS
jgi:hypothetical protein